MSVRGFPSKETVLRLKEQYPPGTRVELICMDDPHTESEFANINLADDEFVIAVNNNGIHDVAWYSRIARQFIGSVFIADAAIKTAHIADAAITNAKIGEISANKITSGLLRGIQVQQIASNGTVLADFYKDTNGGKLTLYDNDGDWNVRLGCEGVGGDNVGGTLILYNKSQDKQSIRGGAATWLRWKLKCRKSSCSSYPDLEKEQTKSYLRCWKQAGKWFFQK